MILILLFYTVIIIILYVCTVHNTIIQVDEKITMLLNDIKCSNTMLLAITGRH